MNTLHCIDCVWAFVPNDTSAGDPASWFCRHINRGESLVLKTLNRRSCEEARADATDCGPDATWFKNHPPPKLQEPEWSRENKKAWWNR